MRRDLVGPRWFATDASTVKGIYIPKRFSQLYINQELDATRNFCINVEKSKFSFERSEFSAVWSVRRNNFSTF